LPGIVTNGQADFTGLPTDDALNGGTVVGHRTPPAPFVGPIARRIGWIENLPT
jgi:hypothetical protein